MLRQRAVSYALSIRCCKRKLRLLFPCLLLLSLVVSVVRNHVDLTVDILEGTVEDPASEMKKYNVAIVGCTKDNTQYIANTVGIIDGIGAQFKSYQVVLYENDSKDDTREQMLALKKDNYEYILEDNVMRNETKVLVLAACRRKLLHRVQQIDETNEPGDKFDFVIVIDMDNVIKSGKITSTIKTSFKYDVALWDVLTANQMDTYYDTYALKTSTFNFRDNVEKERDSSILPEFIKGHYYTFINMKLRRHSGLTKVISAFGGLSIYKTKFGYQCIDSYNGLDSNGHVICEHVNFNECMLREGAKIFINNEMMTGSEFDRGAR